jgi:glucose-fructose oxidoreductase
LRGIVTGSPEKIPVWQDKYGIKDENVYNYDNFDEIAKNPDIDIIYVVVPHGLHAHFTIRAANAGKHVICEKPMASTVAEADAMLAAAKKNNVILAIGYRLHHDPFHRAGDGAGAQGGFGEIAEVAWRNSVVGPKMNGF